MEGPRYGYELHREFVAELGQVWHLSQSQAYTVLKRLEARGEITSHLIEQRKHPARQTLRITAAGRRKFNEWLEKGASFNARSIRLEFLARLYFTQKFAPKKTGIIYVSQTKALRESMKRLENLLAHLPAEQIYNRLSLELRLQQLKLIQEWMSRIKNQFHISTEETPT